MYTQYRLQKRFICVQFPLHTLSRKQFLIPPHNRRKSKPHAFLSCHRQYAWKKSMRKQSKSGIKYAWINDLHLSSGGGDETNNNSLIIIAITIIIIIIIIST